MALTRTCPFAALLAGIACTYVSESRAQDQPIGILFAAGDIAECDRKPPKLPSKTARATADLLKTEIERAKKLSPEVEIRVLALGDLGYPAGSAEDMKCFADSWGAAEFKVKEEKFKVKDIILPVPGNHDLQTGGGREYYRYFKSTLDNLQADKGSYVLDFPSTGDKRWRLIGLNVYAAPKETGNLVKWLESKLKQATGRCILAFAHPFFYSSGRHGHNDGRGQPQNDVIDLKKPLLPLPQVGMPAIYAVLHAHHASVLVAGHDHHFEQLGRARPGAKPGDLGKSAIADDGVRSFIVGTGGFRLHSNDYKDKWAFSEAYDLTSHGILKIELHRSSYNWQFIPTNPDTSSMKIIKKVDTDNCNLPT